MGFAGGDKEDIDGRKSLVPSMDLNPVEHLWDLYSLQTLQGMNDALIETIGNMESKHHVRGVTQAGGQELVWLWKCIFNLEDAFKSSLQ